MLAILWVLLGLIRRRNHKSTYIYTKYNGQKGFFVIYFITENLIVIVGMVVIWNLQSEGALCS